MPEASDSAFDQDSAAAPRTTPRILVVDDDVTLLLLMTETLRGAGFSVTEATNGVDAVEKCREFRPNLVLLDIEMPEMDGFAACARMRADAGAEDLPIVMVTGLDDAASVHRAFQAGATDFILKPINWPLFQYRVSAILAAAHLSAELASSTERIHSLERVTPDIALVVGRDGAILDQLGLSFSAQGDRVLEDLWPRDVASIMRQRIKRVLKTRRNTSCEFELWGETASRYYEARFLVDGRSSVLVVVQEVTGRTSDTETYQLAYYDQATHLPNRHLFEKKATASLADARLREQRVAVLSVELEGLDPRSGGLGGAGQEMLASDAAQRLVRAVGGPQIDPHPRADQEPSDVARLTPSRFAVLLARAGSREDARAAAAAIRAAFEDEGASAEARTHLEPTIGIALYPEDGEDFPTLLNAAEAAMAEARAEDAGACFYSDSGASGRNRFDLTDELQWAIQQAQLQLHYQPRVIIDSGEIAGIEALLRWHHPLRGFVSLDELMPLAEATGLIRSIGEWVLLTACSAAREWNQAAPTPLPVSVNLSHQEFFREDLVEKVDDILRRVGLDAHLLELELTERTLMRAEDPIDCLEKLHALGIGFMLDDFGTGYSSLAYLKDFPIQALKIDRMFVNGIPGNRKDAAVCEVVIDTAHKFGLKAVAEGVERTEQADFLQRHRCDEMQGYLFSQPMALHDLRAFLSQRDEVKLEA